MHSPNGFLQLGFYTVAFPRGKPVSRMKIQFSGDTSLVPEKSAILLAAVVSTGAVVCPDSLLFPFSTGVNARVRCRRRSFRPGLPSVLVARAAVAAAAAAAAAAVRRYSTGPGSAGR